MQTKVQNRERIPDRTAALDPRNHQPIAAVPGGDRVKAWGQARNESHKMQRKWFVSGQWCPQRVGHSRGRQLCRGSRSHCLPPHEHRVSTVSLALGRNSGHTYKRAGHEPPVTVFSEQFSSGTFGGNSLKLPLGGAGHGGRKYAPGPAGRASWDLIGRKCPPNRQHLAEPRDIVAERLVGKSHTSANRPKTLSTAPCRPVSGQVLFAIEPQNPALARVAAKSPWADEGRCDV